MPFLLPSRVNIIPKTKRVMIQKMGRELTLFRQLCQPPNTYYCEIERHRKSGRHKESQDSLKVRGVRFILAVLFDWGVQSRTEILVYSCRTISILFRTQGWDVWTLISIQSSKPSGCQSHQLFLSDSSSAASCSGFSEQGKLKRFPSHQTLPAYGHKGTKTSRFCIKKLEQWVSKDIHS